jgi:teichuronic acid exporter
VAPELVKIAIGPNWMGAITPLALVALTIPIRMIGSIVSTTIMSVGRVDIAMITTIIGAIITPPMFFFGSRYGIFGLSVAWVVVAPVMFVLNMYRALPILGLTMRDVVRECWRPLVIAGAMFGSVAEARQLLVALPIGLLAVSLVLVGAVVNLFGTWLINREAAIETLQLLFPSRFARFRRSASTLVAL